MNKYIEDLFSVIKYKESLQKILSFDGITILPSKDRKLNLDTFIITLDDKIVYKMYYVSDIAEKYSDRVSSHKLSNVQILKDMGVKDNEIIKAKKDALKLIEQHYTGHNRRCCYRKHYEYMILSTAVDRVTGNVSKCIVCGKPTANNRTICDNMSCSNMFIDMMIENRHTMKGGK